MQEKKSYQHAAFSIVELLVAMGIASIVITTAVGTVGQIFLSQKKILLSQDFYSEARFLMERIVQIARNNTIDYDRYFIEIGPSATCTDFNEKQIPIDHTNAKLLEGDPNNSLENRTNLGYPNIFYWDTNEDNKPDRQLGGMNLDANADPCTQAFHTNPEAEDTINTLYMINSTRTLQTAIKREATSKIHIQRRLGADTNNDGDIDTWTEFTQWNPGRHTCELFEDAEFNTAITDPDDFTTLTALGINDADACKQAHDWTIISPHAIEIETLTFNPAPDRDPFLNFRVNNAQVHPHVFIFMKTKLRRDNLHPFTLTFDEGKEPSLTLQTSASSRVFGDPRK